MNRAEFLNMLRRELQETDENIKSMTWEYPAQYEMSYIKGSKDVLEWIIEYLEENTAWTK